MRNYINSSLVLIPFLCACAMEPLAPPTPRGSDISSPSTHAQRGFPAGSPWVSFYGSGPGIDLGRVANTFRIVNIDADPGLGGFTDADLAALRGDGSARVISYLNIGACESFRSYYDQAPPGHASCVSSGALTAPYHGFPSERWTNPSVPAYQDLIVNYVAPRLVERGVDGFFLDNMEIVEHGAAEQNGPCDASCSQGGLELVAALRRRFPDHLIVMQNATSDVTRLGHAGGVAFPTLLDGVNRESPYWTNDEEAIRHMRAWKAMDLRVNGRPFWLGTQDYVSACNSAHKAEAEALMARSRQDGFNPYIGDGTAGLQRPCFWDDL